MKTTPPLTIIATVTAVPGQEDLLIAAQEILVAETLREPGCLRYELHRSIESPRVVVFVESWETEAAWQAHMQGEAMLRFRASGAGDRIADFALQRLHPIAGAL